MKLSETILEQSDVGFPISRFASPEQILFLDIETTGFTARSSYLYLIGCAYYQNGKWAIIQWMAENYEEEGAVLKAFFEFAASYSFLFHFNGNNFDLPYLTQKWVRKVKAAYSDITPYGGYRDDEDQGQMGALGVLLAIGLFEEDGGCSVNTYYEISSPIFDRISISLHPDYYPGERFEIICRNNSEKNMYIQSAKLNSRKWDKCIFSHESFANGGTLELEMGPRPNRRWGSDTFGNR